MPTVPRPGRKGVYIEFPDYLLEALDARAATDRRTRTTVIIMAVEQHLGIEPPPPKARKRRKKE